MNAFDLGQVVLQAEATVPIGEALGNVLGDPVSVLTVLVGGAVLAASMGVFGYLVLGALVELVAGDVIRSPGRTPRRRA